MTKATTMDDEPAIVTTISLREYGHFLSGRWLASKILISINNETHGITVDFLGVAGFNSAFLNEFFQKIAKACSGRAMDINLIGFESKRLGLMADAEFRRVIALVGGSHVAAVESGDFGGLPEDYGDGYG